MSAKRWKYDSPEPSVRNLTFKHLRDHQSGTAHFACVDGVTVMVAGRGAVICQGIAPFGRRRRGDSELFVRDCRQSWRDVAALEACVRLGILDPITVKNHSDWLAKKLAEADRECLIRQMADYFLAHPNGGLDEIHEAAYDLAKKKRK